MNRLICIVISTVVLMSPFFSIGNCLAQKNRQGTGEEVDAEAASASEHIKPDKILVYKTLENVELSLSVFQPPQHSKENPKPAIVFFHGGGFNVGAPSNFYAQSQYLASRGMVAICVEYRIRSRHKTTQQESIMDAFSAMRWVKVHREELGLAKDRIAVAGGSAGGFLAAAVTTLSGLDQPGEDTSTNTRPNVLILFNSAIDRGPGSRGFERVKAAVGDNWKSISPLHNLYRDFPPTIHFLGTADKNITVASAQRLKEEIERVGGRCDLHLYEQEEHGFFNFGRKDNKYYRLTLIETDKFLTSLGWISGPPTLE